MIVSVPSSRSGSGVYTPQPIDSDADTMRMFARAHERETKKQDRKKKDKARKPIAIWLSENVRQAAEPNT